MTENPNPIDAEVESVLRGDAIALYNIANDIDSDTLAVFREAMYRTALAAGVHEAAFNLGLLLQEEGRADEAVEPVTVAYNLGEAQAALWLADYYEECGQLAIALEWVRRSRILGTARMASWILGRLNREEEICSAIVDFIDSDPWAACEWAVRCPGGLSRKIALLERFLAKGEVDVLIPLANLYEEAERFGDAIRALRASVQSGEPNALYNLGIMLWDHGNEDEAVQMIENAAINGDRLAVQWIEVNGGSAS